MTSDEELETAEMDRATRRTVLTVVASVVSFVVAVALEREVFYRGYGTGNYGSDDYGG